MQTQMYGIYGLPHRLEILERVDRDILGVIFARTFSPQLGEYGVRPAPSRIACMARGTSGASSAASFSCVLPMEIVEARLLVAPGCSSQLLSAWDRVSLLFLDAKIPLSLCKREGERIVTRCHKSVRTCVVE